MALGKERPSSTFFTDTGEWDAFYLRGSLVTTDQVQNMQCNALSIVLYCSTTLMRHECTVSNKCVAYLLYNSCVARTVRSNFTLHFFPSSSPAAFFSFPPARPPAAVEHVLCGTRGEALHAFASLGHPFLVRARVPPGQVPAKA